MAFAYASDPEKIAKFGEKVRDGIGLTKGESAWAVRRAFLESQHAVRFGGADQFGDAETSRKVLRAAQVFLRGEKLEKLADTDSGLKFFRKYYDSSRKLKQLVEPFKLAPDSNSLNTEKSVHKAQEALHSKKKSA